MSVPRTTLLSPRGERSGQVDLAESLFGAPINEAVIHQAVVRQQAGRRSGTADTKSRAEVSGGGRKPWRQKGTGRARHGSRRSPQWAGGGVVFGPQPRDYRQRMPAAMRRLALRGALSAKQADGALRVVEGFELPEIKTRELLERLTSWKADGKVLLVLAGADHLVERSARNVRHVRVVRADALNVVDVVDADTIVFTRQALTRAEEVYG
jgi:large subunit ribosomal protein L4